MRPIMIVAIMVLAVQASAMESTVTGKITYLSSGVVYTSLGRESGLEDSSQVYVIKGRDTIAVLQVFAVSSKSSACTVVRLTGTLAIDQTVVATVTREEPVAEVDTSSTGTGPVSTPRADTRFQLRPKGGSEDFVTVRGRLSAQYYTTMYDVADYNIAQPGLVFNMQATARDIPLKFEMYTNLRVLSIGGRSPFAGGARNQSRLYTLSLSYDNGSTAATLGRIIPTVAPMIGYVDGILLSQRFGNVAVGSIIGYQPDYSLREMNSQYRKVAVFARYQGEQNFTVGMAYARTYFESTLDREVTNMQVRYTSSANLSVYANSDIDIRTKSGSEFILSPVLTSAFVNVNYRISRLLSVGIGGDASRPYYAFSAVRNVPDSLLSSRLRGGVNFSINVLFPGGISLYNTYTPRSSESSFGKEYSNYSSVNFANVLSSGVNLRSNLNVNANAFTTSMGYGLQLNRNLMSLVDLTLRYQQYEYTVRQIHQSSVSRTLGADVLVALTRQLSFVTSYDRLQGYGMTSHSVFAEFSLRF